MKIKLSKKPLKTIDLQGKKYELYQIIADEDIHVKYGKESATIKKGTKGGYIDKYTYDTSVLTNTWITKGSVVVDSDLVGSFYIGNDSHIFHSHMESLECCTVIKDSSLKGSFIFETSESLFVSSKLVTGGKIVFRGNCSVTNSELAIGSKVTRIIQDLTLEDSKMYGDFSITGRTNFISQADISSDKYASYSNVTLKGNIHINGGMISDVTLDGYIYTKSTELENISLCGNFMLRDVTIKNARMVHIQAPSDFTYYSLSEGNYNLNRISKPINIFDKKKYDLFEVMTSKAKSFYSTKILGLIEEYDMYKIRKFLV